MTAREASLLRANNNMCPMCGRRIYERPLLKRVFTLESVQWNNDISSTMKSYLIHELSSDRNLFAVHPECVESEFFLNGYNMSAEKFAWVKEISEELNKCSKGYKAIKEAVLTAQRKRCYLCREAMTEDETFLHRHSSYSPYRYSNAVAVCAMCNRHTQRDSKGILTLCSIL